MPRLRRTDARACARCRAARNRPDPHAPRGHGRRHARPTPDAAALTTAHDQRRATAHTRRLQRAARARQALQRHQEAGWLGSRCAASMIRTTSISISNLRCRIPIRYLICASLADRLGVPREAVVIEAAVDKEPRQALSSLCPAPVRLSAAGDPGRSSRDRVHRPEPTEVLACSVRIPCRVLPVPERCYTSARRVSTRRVVSLLVTPVVP